MLDKNDNDSESEHTRKCKAPKRKSASRKKNQAARVSCKRPRPIETDTSSDSDDEDMLYSLCDNVSTVYVIAFFREWIQYWKFLFFIQSRLFNPKNEHIHEIVERAASQEKQRNKNWRRKHQLVVTKSAAQARSATSSIFEDSTSDLIYNTLTKKR